MTAKRRLRLSTARGREIGDLLREARRTTEYSTTDLGKAMGLDQANVSHLENGNRTTTDDRLLFYIGYCQAPRAMQKELLTLLRERDFNHLVRPHQPHVPDKLRTLGGPVRPKAPGVRRRRGGLARHHAIS